MKFDPVGQFLQMLSVERNAARLTLDAYGRDLADVCETLGVDARGLLRLGETDIARYFETLEARGLAASSLLRRRSAIRQFYRFCLSENLIDADPSRKIAAARKGRALPKILSRTEIEALIRAADGPALKEQSVSANKKPAHQAIRLECLIEMAYASGMRISELVGLRLDAVARDPAYLIVKGKGGVERLVPLNPSARAAIKAYLDIRPHFLPRGDKA
ncbi:MAG TPA: site-specific integrase, partial [Asticcacaulis sp.]|nr:site-specific integrase [Asticcacaulis sp.]